mmetsp:Transcript_30518/g.72001  ORF Transcript_30518/g.72001 Transcript_30518/m.72001 type:complete len:107 (+) Transcript_30518:55-375(+)
MRRQLKYDPTNTLNRVAAAGTSEIGRVTAIATAIDPQQQQQSSGNNRGATATAIGSQQQSIRNNIRRQHSSATAIDTQSASSTRRRKGQAPSRRALVQDERLQEER